MKSVLVVDDEPLILEIIQEALVAGGYRVLTANGGDTAFQILQREAIDLVLLDVEMPGKNGFTLCKEIGAQYQVPMLFVTGCTRSFSGKREDFVALWNSQFTLGTTDILYKPFTLALLNEKVEALIGEGDAVTHGQNR